MFEQRSDVAICGGGFAGLTLALQLRRRLPELKLILFDKLTRPLPEATFKIGESTTEAGTFYLSEILGLSSYLRDNHLPKLGFRFFFGGGTRPINERPEFGLTSFPVIPSYNLDRGIFENDLRRLLEEKGVTLCEGYSVKEASLGDNGRDHKLAVNELETGATKTHSCRWLVDAMGRRRFLQKKLGLGRAYGSKCGAVWFRLDGRIDLGDLVPQHEKKWHQRVPDRDRYYSTNHLMGSGYWVWLIPLSSGKTSIGIVTLEDVHPFEKYNTFPKALSWLQENEPYLANCIAHQQPLDFRCMRRYSYSSTRVLSEERWACTGDAAFFADPLYAPSTDLIALTNSAIVDLIESDRSDQLCTQQTNHYSQSLLALNNVLTQNIQSGYPLFGNPGLMACKVIWDTAGGWAFLASQVFNSIFTDPQKSEEIRRVKGSFYFLTKQMHQLFEEWGHRSSARLNFKFIDFLQLSILRDLRDRNLDTGKSLSELVNDQKENLARMEELAQAIFLTAVTDVMPEELGRFKDPVWLNAWRLSLNSDGWEKDGMFRPFSIPRDLTTIRQEIQDLFVSDSIAPQKFQRSESIPSS